MLFNQKSLQTIEHRKHLLVFKTSWRCLQHVFSVTILRLPRRLEDVFKTSLKMSLNTCLEDVLKTYLEDVFKTSRRQTKFLLVISVFNKPKCASNKSLFHKLYLRNLRRTQNASLKPNSFDFRLILKHTSIFILRIKISEASEIRKTKF